MSINVKNLTINFSDGFIPVKNINFRINSKEIFCLIGESGSGKTLTGMGIMGMIDEIGGQIEGSVEFYGKNILKISEKEICKIRGNQIAMVFQDALAALNPLYKINFQLKEVLELHTNLDRISIKKRIKKMISLVKLDGCENVLEKYPHELSGGERQRVVIAMSLLCNPKLIIADEPTTALDVTVQSEILKLFLEIRDKLGTSILFITHDLGVVAEIGDRVAVMYDGEILEEKKVFEFFDNPETQYSKKLLSSRI